MAESFSTTSRFFDNKFYPRGFSRHGDFTIKEAQLLEKYGHALNELDLGKRQPATEDEVKFVAVCRDERQPETEMEKIWMKYTNRIRRPKRFHTLSGGKPQMDAVEEYTESDD
ncbi:DUF413 domain-containing protein [Pectobacteriaceae bacterium CE70]|uniref:Macrodomain Ori protein n=1 Tax=Serratia sp. (strain ATCC 39006) TaxID=104623 RepID=A0A2I5T355_SERS3|nr:MULTISPECIES: DUF413 domain-containing protein [Enterobacterales]WJV62382.1 DUF413 domain-containing protein [Pectobacteriaceae bacterium C52]WJV66690.1 DUF413 domain-containing protein [Pectobacteriaceae bacterium CE70]WJY10688.1 DUF413 domain-containing protein [Pectobacteriaceae bacterium C80]AUG99000.1 DUF413 domain-containing protein [Serratia sp. ATCC 39006]AUH03315.1 DUF413 domain-containing protein [Serratia sp. ATCC 39006]